MVPVYTFYLSPHDYGVLSLLLQFNYIVAIFVGLGLEQSIMKFYHDAKGHLELSRTMSTIILSMTMLSSIVLLVLGYYAEYFSNLIFETGEFAFHIQLTLAAVFCQTINELFMNVFKAEQRSKVYCIVQLFTLFASLSLNILLIVYYGLGVKGILISTLAVHSVSTLLFLLYGVKKYSVSYHLPTLRKILSYGMPLIGAGVGMLVLHTSDQFMLAKLDSITNTGIYSLAARFGVLCNILVASPFQMAWLPRQFQLANKSGNGQLFSNMATYLVLAMLFFSLILSLIITDLLKFMVADSFVDAATTVPLLLLSYVFYSLYVHFQFAFLYKKRTKLLSFVTVAIAGLNILLNYLLIPKYSYLGAALATVISNLALGLSTYSISIQYYRIDFEWRRAIHLFLLVAVLYFMGSSIQVTSTYFSFALKFLVSMFYIPLLWYSNFFKDYEKDFISNGYRKFKINYVSSRRSFRFSQK